MIPGKRAHWFEFVQVTNIDLVPRLGASRQHLWLRALRRGHARPAVRPDLFSATRRAQHSDVMVVTVRRRCGLSDRREGNGWMARPRASQSRESRGQRM